MHIVMLYAKETIALSVISIQELYEGKSTKHEEKEQFLLATISPLKILPYTYEVAQFTGEIARDIGHPIELADATIAATAIINDCSLYTLHAKYFINIPKLQILHIQISKAF
jgi:predicted nucleic acid-binding protein